MEAATRALLARGCVIPAHPLALTAARTMDERRQRALTRYYMDAGAGGVAVGVHTTQFAIRDRELYEPVLALAADTIRSELRRNPRPFVRVAGAIGRTVQAVREADIAARLGYDCVLLSLGALQGASDADLIAHCRAVGDVLPVFGFYLQPAVGGRVLHHEFWHAFAELDCVCAVKVAPFNRYHTIDVVRAFADAGRDDVPLYTGNDDNIVADLVTPFRFGGRERWIVGGLLGQWAVWTKCAVEMLDVAHAARRSGSVPTSLLAAGATLTAANAAIFDARNGFAGCIAGIHEVLRRQGLLEGTWCVDQAETLSSGQAERIARVCAEHPELMDDEFVAAHRDRWLAP